MPFCIIATSGVGSANLSWNLFFLQNKIFVGRLGARPFWPPGSASGWHAILPEIQQPDGCLASICRDFFVFWLSNFWLLHCAVLCDIYTTTVRRRRRLKIVRFVSYGALCVCVLSDYVTFSTLPRVLHPAQRISSPKQNWRRPLILELPDGLIEIKA